jgi:hypothetical protein
MKRVVLKPLNKRYKQLIKDHGNVWILVKRGETQVFPNEESCLIKSIDNRHSRWVRASEVETMENYWRQMQEGI